MNNENGVSGYFGRSRLNVENATLTIPGNVFIGEGRGDPQVYVGPGATFLCSQKSGRDNDSGFQIGRYESATATVTVCGGTLGFRTGYVRKNSSLIVTNGATLKTDTTHKGFVNGNGDSGDVFVDNATIAPYTTAGKGLIADWFNRHTGAFTVGAGGVTFDTPAFGHLGAVPTGGEAGASITKTGVGVFSLAPNALPVTAREGTLRMGVSPQGWTNALTGAISLDAGAALEVSGDAALGAMTVNADAAQFDAFGLERARSWSCFGNARWTADGFVHVTDGTDLDWGSAIALTARPVRVDHSFTLAFDTYLSYPTWAAGEKWTVFLKKDAAVTTSARDRSGFTGVTNSFGVSVNVYEGNVSFGENGSFVETGLKADSGYSYYSADYAKKSRCRLAYDAAAKRATFAMMDANGREAAWTRTVDLVTCIGTNRAYLSFGGGSGGAAAAMAFSNVRFTSETPAVAEIARVGGVKTLGAGETFTATVKPNEFVDGFLMGRLDYADGATLAVDEVSDGRLPSAPLTLDDHSLWKLTGGAYWREDGSLATSRLLDGGKKNGTAVSVSRYAVDGDWRLAFTYDLGDHSDMPADLVRANILDSSGNGLGVEFRYYENVQNGDGTSTPRKTTQLKLFRRGVPDTAQSLPDLSPIDFVKNGPAKVALAYDAAAQTLTVDLSQKNGSLTRQVVLEDVDMTSILANNTRATVQFTGQVGGLYSENVISDLLFTSDADTAERAAPPAFFGFERLAGAGTLVKTGEADLGLVDDGANADANLRLEGGGLRLRREREEDVTMRDAPNGWTFSHASGRYLANGIQIGMLKSYHKSNAQLRRRVRVGGDWDCTFSLWINGGTPADAVSFFFHNDPRGPQSMGQGNSDAAFTGIQNGFPIAWYFYSGNSGIANRVVAGSMDYENKGQSHLPLKLPGNTTDVAISYRAAEKTLTCVMTQGATVVTNAFTDCDIASAVKDTYAWMGFGVGCGGLQATPRITDFRFTQCATEAAADQDAARHLASVAVAENATVRLETTKSNAVFRVADAVAVAEGKTLTAASLDAPATLAMGTLTLGAASALAGDGATAVKPDALAGELDALTLKGVTLAVSEATRVARSLAASKVMLADGAKLAAPDGKSVSVRAVYVNGVKQPRGTYTSESADWVDSGSVTVSGRGAVFMIR